MKVCLCIVNYNAYECHKMSTEKEQLRNLHGKNCHSSGRKWYFDARYPVPDDHKSGHTRTTFRSKPHEHDWNEPRCTLTFCIEIRPTGWLVRVDNHCSILSFYTVLPPNWRGKKSRWDGLCVCTNVRFPVIHRKTIGLNECGISNDLIGVLKCFVAKAVRNNYPRQLTFPKERGWRIA